jgi:hypothetical protein
MAEAQEQAEAGSFEGKPLREVPLPTAEFLRDDAFGESVLSEYHDRWRSDYGANENLRIFKTAGGIVHGSNPFAAVLIDMILRPDYRVATPADLQAVYDAERRSNAEPPNLRGCYKDAGLVMRTIGEPNGYLAQKLNQQVGLKTELPVVFCLAGLDLVLDDDSPYGLAFEVTEDTRYCSAPIMMEKSGHFDNKDVDRSTGLPTRLGGSERYFYSMQEGLSRLYVGRGWSLDSIWDELANSQPDGRIVLFDNSVPCQKVAKYLAYMDAANKFLQS